ncbi:hypothetical protein GCM10007147_45020 [Nocardiopsis kunsanensis]|uniref:XRE family transcriptional regulator n=1 Tax=Nocardiopsis kunsanensis TaxID=141693 RepID=A0A918XL93_9ACTN|nr:XRE family transcriptional regulator [Nocardiopsis kunsanensis]GHD37173.1 hypothetical protein GCM10007147_45020 [Nocardiopsis kunsanensis]
MLDQWKRWESGKVLPNSEYQRLIASIFGSVSGAMFAAPRDPQDVMRAAGAADPDTTEVLARLQASSVDQATLDALRLTVDRLCADYPTTPAHQLLLEGRSWLSRVGDLLDMRMTLSQHRELLRLSGMLALLVGCLEQDTGATAQAETTRRSAASLGAEAEDQDVIGWSFEMSAWFALTRGDYGAVLAAAEGGIEAAHERSVSVQLRAQQAKAWARIGDRRRVEVALDQGRVLLESLPYPDDPSHHFVVDPKKFDFYSMDVLRTVGEDRIADSLADEVLRSSTDWKGQVTSPMRAAEAWVSKGIIAARGGDLEGAVEHGRSALDGDRKSLPSLAMVCQELGVELHQRYANEQPTIEYIDQLKSLA